MFDKYKRYYDLKLYTKEDVAKFVAGGKITAEQYTEITGDEYVAPEVSSVITEMKTKTAELRAAVYLGSELTAKSLEDAEERLDDAEADITVLKGGSTT